MRFLLLVSIVVSQLAPLRAEWVFSQPEPLPASAGLEFVKRDVRDGAKRVEIHVVTFRFKTHVFAVMDNPEGAFDLEGAATRRGAAAAVNGGYFHPDRTPLGLVIRKGFTIHAIERAKLLSGLVVVSGDGVALSRTGEFSASAKVREALQAGPFLVDGGKTVPGLNDTRSAARTVVFGDNVGRFSLLIGKSATLAEMAQILATPGMVPDGRITRALNLDGGSSTAMWVKQDGSAFYAREWKGVRNYLAIVPR